MTRPLRMLPDNLILKWIDLRGEPIRRRIVIREKVIPIVNNRLQLGLHCRNGQAGTKARDHPVGARSSLFQFLLRKSDRFPDIDSFGELRALDIKQWDRKLEAPRHDPDHGVTATVQQNALADHRRIRIEATTQETLADDDDIVMPFALLALSDVRP